MALRIDSVQGYDEMTLPTLRPKIRSRRKIRLLDASAWIFNRMAEVYDARPSYPASLISALAKLADQAGNRIGDVGAGIGHLALPLSRRGYTVTAFEPAKNMLQRLEAAAALQNLSIRAIHAAAEALPVEPNCLDLLVIADALHFIDTELAAHEIVRVLAPRGLVAVVTCEITLTPFMRQIVKIMQESAPRRPRPMARRRAQLFGVAKLIPQGQMQFFDETAVTAEELERILASISFIGPAMNEERKAAFLSRVHAIAHPRVWARTFTVHVGRRTGSPSARTAAEQEAIPRSGDNGEQQD